LDIQLGLMIKLKEIHRFDILLMVSL